MRRRAGAHGRIVGDSADRRRQRRRQLGGHSGRDEGGSARARAAPPAAAGQDAGVCDGLPRRAGAVPVHHRRRPAGRPCGNPCDAGTAAHRRRHGGRLAQATARPAPEGAGVVAVQRRLALGLGAAPARCELRFQGHAARGRRRAAAPLGARLPPLPSR